MWPLCKKELRQFFGSLTGYMAVAVFLIAAGLVLFVFEDNILDFGYASLDRFFLLAPWLLLLLIPAITMRSFAEEFRTGTYELLATQPITKAQLVAGKYVGALLVVIVALLPTLVYAVAVESLATGQGLDIGAVLGSYLGLVLLSSVFTMIGLYCSSLTANTVVAFLLALVACALLYYGFAAISRLPVFSGGADYWIEWLGIDQHYQSISRGLIDSRDLIYFISMVLLFFVLTIRNLLQR
ncbi:MAG: gliding motility-associated ABC transporter permease subunit GldF [Chitinophagales bacterium]|jgi:ABC-2 type transport system permease protein|nr:gliding motility-associated ABC transporter permease subunit GldF [Chitinophagales bacterium]